MLILDDWIGGVGGATVGEASIVTGSNRANFQMRVFNGPGSVVQCSKSSR